jgi:hypothetical protein
MQKLRGYRVWKRVFLWPKEKVLRTWNEHEEINETSFSFEFFWRTCRARSLVFPGTGEKKWIASYVLAQKVRWFPRGEFPKVNIHSENLQIIFSVLVLTVYTL